MKAPSPAGGGVMEIAYTHYTNVDCHFVRPYEPGDRLVRGYSGTIDIDGGELVEEITERLFARHNRDHRPDGRPCPAMSVGDVVVARSCEGADRAARALLLQQPGLHYDLWWAWSRIVLRALLEAAAVSGVAAGRWRRVYPVLVERWAWTLMAADLAGPRGALRRCGELGDDAIEAVAVDASQGLDLFERDVIDRLGSRCVGSVGVTVLWGVQMSRRPPPGVSCGEWFAARWRAVALPNRDEVNLGQLVADERVAARQNELTLGPSSSAALPVRLT